MSSVLHEWQTHGHRYRLCRGRMKVEGWQELPPFQALWVLRAQLADSQARRVLLGALRGHSQWQLSANLADPGVLEWEVEQRRVIVLDHPIAPLLLGRGPATAPLKTPPQRIEAHHERAWIDVMVVDDHLPARPLARTRFRLTLPDGSVREGALNDQAHLRLDDLEPGKCWLELSDIGRDLDT